MSDDRHECCLFTHPLCGCPIVPPDKNRRSIDCENERCFNKRLDGETGMGAKKAIQSISPRPSSRKYGHLDHKPMCLIELVEATVNTRAHGVRPPEPRRATWNEDGSLDCEHSHPAHSISPEEASLLRAFTRLHDLSDAIFFAAFIRTRRASLTESASGNAAATSGSRVTIIASCGKRFTYLPRMPPVKSYSGRMLSLNFAELALFRGISVTRPPETASRSRLH